MTAAVPLRGVNPAGARASGGSAVVPAEQSVSARLAARRTSALGGLKMLAASGLAAAALAVVGGMAWWMVGARPPAASQPRAPEVAQTRAKPVADEREVPAAPPPVESLADLVDRIDDGVVLIVVLDEAGEEVGLGSGFVIDTEGHVATNYHVVDEAVTAKVKFRDGFETEAAGLYACDPNADLAILSLRHKPARLEVLSLAAEARLRQGTDVIALGHPRGFGFTVTNGIVSALRKTSELPGILPALLAAPEDQEWIQTTAAISGGNSGGPLLLPTGEVIGINTWVADGENLGFAAHVRHLVALAQRPLPPNKTLAEFNRQQPTRNEQAMTAAFGGKLSEARQAVSALRWTPSTPEEFARIQFLAEGTWWAASKQLEQPQLDELAAELGQVAWSYAQHVRAANLLSTDGLAAGQKGVFFFGTVKSVDPQGRRLMVDLAGRGYVLSVEDLRATSGARFRVNDPCAVLGIRTRSVPESDAQPRPIHHIEAGVIASVSWGQLPPHAALRVAHDLVAFKRQDQGFLPLVQSSAELFPQIELGDHNQTAVWNRCTMNVDGHQFDGVRIRTPPGQPQDMIWACASPDDALEGWYIAAVSGKMNGFDRYTTLQGLSVEGRTLANRGTCFTQYLPAERLQPDAEYILWFTFAVRVPATLHMAVRFVPAGSIDPRPEVILAALGATSPGVPRLNFSAGGGAVPRPMGTR